MDCQPFSICGALKIFLRGYMSPFRNIWLCFIVYSNLVFAVTFCESLRSSLQSAVCHQNGRLKAATLSLLGKIPFQVNGCVLCHSLSISTPLWRVKQLTLQLFSLQNLGGLNMPAAVLSYYVLLYLISSMLCKSSVLNSFLMNDSEKFCL